MRSPVFAPLDANNFVRLMGGVLLQDSFPASQPDVQQRLQLTLRCFSISYCPTLFLAG